jgi:hypothetical protein
MALGAIEEEQTFDDCEQSVGLCFGIGESNACGCWVARQKLACSLKAKPQRGEGSA